MPPRPAVHPSKREAIFQLCNFLCDSTIEKLSDLADGKVLLKTIHTKFSLLSNDCPSTCSPEDENKELSEPSDIINVIKNENDETFLNPAKEADVSRFNYIQKFIDDYYEINSQEIINYNEKNELELIKVTIFVLSEIVKHLNVINREHLETLFHLDTKYQDELTEIFKTFITERETLSKQTIEKLLSKSAKKASPLVTPRRTSLRRISLIEHNSPKESFSAPNEDVFTNSPLKAYFESPIFKKEDIQRKDKEILAMKRILDAEEEEQQRKFSEMKKELEKKDKDYKELEKKLSRLLQKKDEDIELVNNAYRSLSCEHEKLLKEYSCTKEFYVNRVMELTTQLAETKKILEEREEQDKLNRIESLETSESKCSPSKIEDGLRIEVAILKERIKSMELKIYAFKKQLSERVLSDLKEKKSPGNLNRSYEEFWNELDKQRKMEEETVAQLIQEDNRNLSAKLNEANAMIQNLIKEKDNLKEQLASQSRTFNEQIRPKEVSSVSTATENLSVPEILDSSKIPETERFLKSLSHSSDIMDSDNSTPYEQSIDSAESEQIINTDKYSPAVLWNMHDTQMPESTGFCVQDSVPSENSLDVINDLGEKNIKPENNEPDISLSQENEYELGNLNFDVFLNELKKLTKNGSFQKVLQVFGRRKNEINGKNKSNRLDLQDLLKTITECVCVAVALNAEASAANVQDKCCSTDENELYGVKQNIELNKIKNELGAVSKKYESELLEYKIKIEELQKMKATMAYKCQAYDQTLLQKNKTIDDLISKYQEQKIKIENMYKKCIEYKDTIGKLLDINKKERKVRDTMKTRAIDLYKEKKKCESMYKLSKEENNRLKQELKKLKAEIGKLLWEKEKKPNISAAFSKDAFPSRESYVGTPNHQNIKSELHSSTFQGTDNESLLANAFHKSISHYVTENEEDFFDYNSLDTIKKEYEDDRVEELKRRNSLYPIHLQSSYPLEANLETTYASLYVKDGEKFKEEERCSKKRKLDCPVLEEPSTSSILDTPVAKPKRMIATPKSLQKYIRNIRYKNTFKWKPQKS